jgi:hypothetical protein
MDYLMADINWLAMQLYGTLHYLDSALNTGTKPSWISE